MTTYAYDLTLNDSEFAMLHMGLEFWITLWIFDIHLKITLYNLE